MILYRQTSFFMKRTYEEEVPVIYMTLYHPSYETRKTQIAEKAGGALKIFLPLITVHKDLHFSKEVAKPRQSLAVRPWRLSDLDLFHSSVVVIYLSNQCWATKVTRAITKAGAEVAIYQTTTRL